MPLYPNALAATLLTISSPLLLANTVIVNMPASEITASYSIGVSYQEWYMPSDTRQIFRNDITESGIYGDLFGFTDRAANASMSINETPSPSIFIHTSTFTAVEPNASTQAYSNADAHLRYYFRIIGPSGQVPINVKAHAEAFCSESVFGTCGASRQTYGGIDGFQRAAFANASLDIGGFGQLINISAFPSIGAGGRMSSAINEVDFNKTLTFSTNYNYSIDLNAHAAGISNSQWGGGDTWTQAFIDPTFTLAPGIANPELYSFAFSEGIGNTPAVPEPSTALFSLAGLGVIALARRRQQQRNCA